MMDPLQGSQSGESTHEEACPKRLAFVVIGMHRSGTSAMTRTLSLLGATLPHGLMPPQSGNNETGFWESLNIAALNDQVLQALGSSWDDVFAIRLGSCLPRLDSVYLQRAVELVEEEFGRSELIVLKDPRISVLVDFWAQALSQAGYSVHYIIMVRNPLEVAASLHQRDGFGQEKSWLLWSSYMLSAERDSRDHPRIFVSYSELMGNWRAVQSRIAESAGVLFPRDSGEAAVEIDQFLDHRLHHHRAGQQDLLSRSDVPDLVKALYRNVCAAHEHGLRDMLALDAAAAELLKAEQLVGPLLADLRASSLDLAGRIADLNEACASANARADGLSKQLESERSARQRQEQRNDELAASLAEAEATRGV